MNDIIACGGFFIKQVHLKRDSFFRFLPEFLFRNPCQKSKHETPNPAQPKYVQKRQTQTQTPKKIWADRPTGGKFG